MEGVESKRIYSVIWIIRMILLTHKYTELTMENLFQTITLELTMEKMGALSPDGIDSCLTVRRMNTAVCQI